MELVDRFFKFDDRDHTDYEKCPPVLTNQQLEHIKMKVKNYNPKPARKGAFKKKLSKKQRKQKQ